MTRSGQRLIVGHKVSHQKLQGGREFLDVQQGDIARPALNQTDVGTVQAGDLRQFLLRDLLLQPKLPQPLPKTDEHVGQESFPQPDYAVESP